MLKVLVVDDDFKIRKLVKVNLEKRGYNVTEATDGESAITRMRQNMPDLILLDLIMPGVDGIEVCKWVRQRGDTPIIVLSAQADEELKVHALDEGADDYVIKPFGYSELLARVRAVMRRAGESTGEITGEGAKIAIEEFVVDLGARRAFVQNNDIHLTRTEFALLSELGKNLDSILSHDELLGRVWGPEYRGSSHYLHVYLGRVRKKMGEKHSPLLETVPGLGYILHSSLPS
ncbi:MAG: response regulator transcription factor [Chitinophagaceae bacterium]|nr:response regulator transcription factor [Anaerolineae bacterium]